MQYRTGTTREKYQALFKERVNQKKYEVPMESLNYLVDIKRSRAIVTMTQSYSNNSSDTVDVEYIFPILVKSCLIDFTAIVGDQRFIGKVGEKEEVRARKIELQENAVPFIAAENHDEYRDLVKLNIGYLKSGEKLSVELKFSLCLDISSRHTFKLLVPVVTLPRYLPTKHMSETSSNGSNSSKPSIVNEAPEDKSLKFTIMNSYNINFQIKVLKEDKEGRITFESLSFPMEDLDVFEDPSILQITLKKGQIHFPNTDIEFLFRRDIDSACISTSNTDQFRSSVHAMVFCPQPISSCISTSLIPAAALSTFIIPPLDKDRRTKTLLYFLLLDYSEAMHTNKLTLLTQVVSKLINEMPKESHFMVAKFSDTYEWLMESPQPCSNDNKTKMIAKLAQEAKGRGGIDIAPLLKATLEMDFGLNLLRSIIIVSNGNLKEQGVLERVMIQSRSFIDTRISAIGIGNGSSDSFLRVVSSKGCGLMETVCSPNQVDERIYLFMKRLRAKNISDIKFEYDETVFLKVLPTIDSNQKHLKSAVFEIQAYFRKGVSLKKYSVLMNYFDEEDNSRKSLTILIDLAAATLATEMYKLMINDLLLNSDELKVLGKDNALRKEIGQNWPVKLAVEAQVFSTETAYLAITVVTPVDFDPIKGNLKNIGLEHTGTQPSKQVIIPGIVCSDYLKKASVSNTMETNLSKAKFSLSSFDLMSRRHVKERSPYGLSQTQSTKNQSSSGDSSSQGLFSKASVDWNQSEERQFQEIAK